MNTIHNLSDPGFIPLLVHFRTLAKKLYTQIEVELKQTTINRYYYVLLIILRKQQITQQNLCKELNIDKASMVRIIDYLAKHGYVSRLVNPDDRRSFVIMPTASADEIYFDLKNAFQKANEMCLKGFTPKEIKLFYTMLDSINRNIENENNPKK